MRFRDLPGARVHVRVKATYDSPFEAILSERVPAAPVIHVSPSVVPDNFDLVLDGAMATVTTVRRPTDALRLNRELGSGRALLAQVTDLAPDGSVDLQIVFFTGHPVDLGAVDVGVDEYVQQRADAIAPRRSIRDVQLWLADECTFTVGKHAYAFLIAGPALDEVLEDDPEAHPRNNHTARDIDLTGAFGIAGNHLRFVATPKDMPSGGSIYVVSKLTTTRSSNGALRLARASLSFRDWTSTGQIQVQTRTQLALLTEDESSYLKKWDEFGSVEGELFLERARTYGTVRFANAVPNRDGTVTVTLTDAAPAAIEALRSGELRELEPVDEVPTFIADQGMSFEDFSRVLDREADSSPKQRAKRSQPQHINVVNFDDQYDALTLEIENLPSEGALVLSTAGERAQIKRRNSARRAIRTGRSVNPQLGLLLEPQGHVTSLRSPQRIKPLTAHVQAKVFKDPPTPRQVAAVDVALNTPDIALIQGPPGTGKTTVIAAILERLNELDTKSGTSQRGQVLLSSSQHDAVENMIARISLNGLPVPKFGQRPGAGEELNRFEVALEEWCTKIARDLRERNPQVGELEDEAAVSELYRQYLATPTHQLALTLTTRISEVAQTILGPDLSAAATNLASRLEAEELLTTTQGQLVLAAQRLRVLPDSFADDGPDRASDALVDLEDRLSDDESSLLQLATDWNPNHGVPPFLDQLRLTKLDLLDRLTAPPVFRVEKHSDEVLDFAERAVEQIRSTGRTATDRKTAAIVEFLAELEGNPQGIIDSVAEFSFAFAATVQQSVNKQMQRQKGLNGGDSDEGLEYEYVIVDEAARVSPRDLMISMAQGKKIILVGDHRQLPHIIDDEVARQMEAGEDGKPESEWLKKSMFEYLFAERLKALEDEDGITRRVTLDKQFRMHPDLGDFVSRNFYERFDPEERFGSGLPASVFAHDLPGSGGKPALWIDVPSSAGRQKREGMSWTRPAEADAIADRLSNWIQSPAADGMSFGVISFYKAQAELIRKQLRQRLGSEIVNNPRIRVGTVDSFQGMEFDVVFLSIVRTLTNHALPHSHDRARQARGAFGHLGLYNRLNVSMSRQKRLLVAVGDPALVTNNLADEFIPGLVDFYRLAKDEGPSQQASSPAAAIPQRGTPPRPAPVTPASRAQPPQHPTPATIRTNAEKGPAAASNDARGETPQSIPPHSPKPRPAESVTSVFDRIFRRGRR